MALGLNEESRRMAILRELLQLSQTEFARKIMISQGALSQIESGRSSLSMETLRNLSLEFNVNCNWLVNGKGDIFNQAVGKARSVLNKNLVPLVNRKAAAGYAKGYEDKNYLNTLESYYLPYFGKDGEYRMFEIEGDSMVPSLFSEEVVITQKVENNKDIKNDAMAVILTEEGLNVKRIEIKPRRKYITLVPDNPDYQVKEISFDQINEFWKVEGKITRRFLKTDNNSIFQLGRLEKQLEIIKKKLDSLG